MHPRARPPFPALLSLALVGLTPACARKEAPPLTVGDVSFSARQLAGLSEERRHTLAMLAGVARAIAEGRIDSLGAPIVDEAEADRALDVLAADLTLEAHDIGDDVLRARYMTDPEYELTVRHILFFSERWRSPSERAQARAKAERALALLRDGADFAETAAKLSEEPGAQGRQGLLRPGREGSWVPEFWNAAKALEVGGMSGVVETRYGYHILRLEDRKIVPFEEARSRVARNVASMMDDPRETMRAWLTDARSRVSVAEDVVSAYGHSSIPGDAVLATWNGGAIHENDLMLWAAAAPEAERPTLRAGDPDAFREAVLALAARRMALQEVRRRGISVPAAERDEVRRDWIDRTARWAATLGFARNRSPEQVATAALGALALTSQGADIARREVTAIAPLIERFYRIGGAGEGRRR